MFKISCFADEISPDLFEQINVMKENNIQYVELRSVWEKNVLDLSDKELDTVKREFNKNGIGVSSIGSPIGKVNIKDDFEGHLERFKRAISVALKMETQYIRIFSFYVDRKELDTYRQAVIERLKQMIEIAEANSIILLHENEANIYGEASVRCVDLFDSLPYVGFKAVFDFSNFAVAGEDVYNESFPRLKNHIEYIHIKDFNKSKGEIVVAGKGDGYIKEILNELRHKEGMFLSLEPHLTQAGQYKGFSGPERFKEAVTALCKILEELELG